MTGPRIEFSNLLRLTEERRAKLMKMKRKKQMSEGLSVTVVYRASGSSQTGTIGIRV